jgi:hypothetical protein
MEPEVWNLYLFALKSPQTTQKYQGRMLKFFEFVGIDGNIIQKKSLNFITRAKSEGSQWVFNCVLRFMSYQVDRVNKRNRWLYGPKLHQEYQALFRYCRYSYSMEEDNLRSSKRKKFC